MGSEMCIRDSLTVAQGESVISRVALVEYVEALSNAPDATKELINQLLKD